MNTSTQSGEDVVTDADIALETTKIHTAEALNNPEAPPADPAPERKAKQDPKPAKDPEPPKTMADERREEMERRHKARRDAEMQANAQARGETTTPAQQVDNTSQGEVQSEASTSFDLPDNLRRLEDGTYVVTQKVNGKEQEVPYSRVLQDAQKSAAGQAALREAAELRKQNAELQAQLAQGLKTQPSSDVAVSAPSQRDEQQAVSRETLNKAFIEDDPNASDAILARLNREPQYVDSGQIIDQATQNALFKIEQKTAIASVSSDPTHGQVNARILADPNLSKIADQYSAEILQSEPGLDMAGNIAKALEMTREKLAGFSPAPAPASDALSARTAHKVAHTQANQPTGTTQRQPARGPVVTTPLSARNQLRASRIAGG